MKPTTRRAAFLLMSALTAAGFSFSAHAVDLGVQSKVWPITETDIREVIMKQMVAAHVENKLTEFRDKGLNYLDSLPARGLPLADKTETSYMDPSIVLANDISVPVKGADGSYAWQVLYHKGLRVNPLENRTFSTAYLFFDGSNKEQRDWAAGLASDMSNRLMPIDTTGTNFKEVVKAFGRPVFYATDQQLQRFQITKTPTLVYQGAGSHSLYMALTTFAQPYRTEDFHQYWPPQMTPVSGRNPTGKQQ
jgi:conjugal transfer pilus assembly protein TraW